MMSTDRGGSGSEVVQSGRRALRSEYQSRRNGPAMSGQEGAGPVGSPGRSKGTEVCRHSTPQSPLNPLARCRSLESAAVTRVSPQTPSPEVGIAPSSQPQRHWGSGMSETATAYPLGWQGNQQANAGKRGQPMQTPRLHGCSGTRPGCIVTPKEPKGDPNRASPTPPILQVTDPRALPSPIYRRTHQPCFIPHTPSTHQQPCPTLTSRTSPRPRE